MSPYQVTVNIIKGKIIEDQKKKISTACVYVRIINYINVDCSKILRFMEV